MSKLAIFVEHGVIKNWFMLQAVRMSSDGRTREVWRARQNGVRVVTLASWVLCKLPKHEPVLLHTMMSAEASENPWIALAIQWSSF